MIQPTHKLKDHMGKTHNLIQARELNKTAHALSKVQILWDGNKNWMPPYELRTKNL